MIEKRTSIRMIKTESPPLAQKIKIGKRVPRIRATASQVVHHQKTKIGRRTEIRTGKKKTRRGLEIRTGSPVPALKISTGIRIKTGITQAVQRTKIEKTRTGKKRNTRKVITEQFINQ